MRFQKGHKINRGKKHVNRKSPPPFSAEHRRKMSESHMGHPCWTLGKPLSEEHKKKLSELSKGRTFSKETRRKLSNAHKGLEFSKEHRKKLSESHKGITLSIETRRKLSGENNHGWKGGITPINQAIRASLEYKLWREAVFRRDNFICIWCGVKGGWSKELKKQVKLNADHIKPFSLFPELRFAIDNGRTLCIDCHKKTDTYGWKLRNSPLRPSRAINK